MYDNDIDIIIINILTILVYGSLSHTFHEVLMGCLDCLHSLHPPGGSTAGDFRGCVVLLTVGSSAVRHEAPDHLQLRILETPETPLLGAWKAGLQSSSRTGWGFAAKSRMMP